MKYEDYLKLYEEKKGTYQRCLDAIASGDVILNKCDAKDFNIKTSSGDVNATLLSDKDFTVNSASGDVNVPKSGSGGKCRVKTDSGDVNISVVKE